MNEPFARLVDPFVQYVIRLLGRFDGPAEHQPDIPEVQDELVRLVTKAREGSSSYDRPRDFTDLAERALVYWADEVLVDSAWVHAGDDWRKNGLLEQRLYQRAVGGHDFYVRADQARAQSLDALETFYLCVALGFRGSRRVRGTHAPARRPGAGRGGEPLGPDLQRWVAATHTEVRPELARFLGAAGPSPPDPAAPPRRALLLRVSALTAATVLVTLAAWILTEHLG